MKRLLVLSVCSLSAFLLIGCQQFPAFLVGRWKADKGGWEFVFEPDGTISSAVVSLGRVTMKPGQVTTTPMKLGGKGVFEPGQWTVQYTPEPRELLVEIAIDHFRVERGDNVVQGQSRDFFIGPVSEDGQMWWADRFSFPEYIVDTKKHPNYKLPFDPNDNPQDSLIFQKVTGSK